MTRRSALLKLSLAPFALGTAAKAVAGQTTANPVLVEYVKFSYSANRYEWHWLYADGRIEPTGVYWDGVNPKWPDRGMWIGKNEP